MASNEDDGRAIGIRKLLLNFKTIYIGQFQVQNHAAWAIGLVALEKVSRALECSCPVSRRLQKAAQGLTDARIIIHNKDERRCLIHIPENRPPRSSEECLDPSNIRFRPPVQTPRRHQNSILNMLYYTDRSLFSDFVQLTNVSTLPLGRSYDSKGAQRLSGANIRLKFVKGG